jgi:hypothetical protein
VTLSTRPSLQGRFSLVFSGDPALQPRPDDLPADAGKEDAAERVKAQEKYDHDLTVCRETGNWQTLIVPGVPATLFTFEIPKGEKRRALIDMFSTLMAEGKSTVAASRLFRGALKDVTNWPGPKLTFTREDGLHLVADSLVEFLDEECSPRIIGELSGQVWERLTQTPGK